MPEHRPHDHRWRRDALIVAVVTLALLVPFSGKAFHIDDPMYLWSAQQILKHPLDFYGFEINWSGPVRPMHLELQNPPLTSYFMAPAILAGGLNEWALHLWFIVPAVGAALGTLALARSLCVRPMLGTLASVVTPGFLVCANSVMSDVLMLCLWLWSIVAWRAALRTGSPWWFIAAGVLISGAALSKYFAISLVPLLAVYSCVRWGRPGWSLLWLAIPIAALGLFEWWSFRLYGHGLVGRALWYSRGYQREAGETFGVSRMAIGLAVLGGGAASIVFFSGRLWSARTLLLGVIGGFLIAAVLTALRSWNDTPTVEFGQPRYLLVLQCALWIVGGVSVWMLIAGDLWKHRNADSVLLALWVAGVFVFSTFLNWSVTARTMLPAIPAVGLLIERGLERNLRREPSRAWWTIAWPLAPLAMLSLVVLWGDYRLAGGQREAAAKVAAIPRPADTTLWFQGHWGFQWYLERLGGRALNFASPQASVGDLIALPLLNSNVVGMPPDVLEPRQHVEVPVAPWATTMSPRLGAGFHSSVYGPLPFVFGSTDPDVYEVMRLRTPPHKQ